MAPVFEFLPDRFSIGSVVVPGRNLRTAETGSTQFEVNAFLATAGLGRRIIQVKTKGVLFSQGHAADSVFYLQKGCAKLVVVSRSGKEATIALFSAGDFIGEEAIAGTGGLRLATAVTTTGNSGGNDRHHPIPRQLLHEPLPSAGFYSIQRWYPRSQVIAQCDSARLSTAFLISAFTHLVQCRRRGEQTL